jgi:hypothetical protein
VTDVCPRCSFRRLSGGAGVENGGQVGAEVDDGAIMKIDVGVGML